MRLQGTALCSNVCCIARGCHLQSNRQFQFICAHMDNIDLRDPMLYCTAVVVRVGGAAARIALHLPRVEGGLSQFLFGGLQRMLCSEGSAANAPQRRVKQSRWCSVGLPWACCVHDSLAWPVVAIRQDPSYSNAQPMVALLHSSYLATMTRLLTSRWHLADWPT